MVRLEGAKAEKQPSVEAGVASRYRHSIFLPSADEDQGDRNSVWAAGVTAGLDPNLGSPRIYWNPAKYRMYLRAALGTQATWLFRVFATRITSSASQMCSAGAIHCGGGALEEI